METSNAVGYQYKLGKISRLEAELRLREIGLFPVDIQDLIEQWDEENASKNKI